MRMDCIADPEWLKEARIGEHNPESIEYGISSITFCSRRPFNSTRLNELVGFMKMRSASSSSSSSSPSSALRGSVTEAGRRAALRVVRAKGVIWIGSQQSHWFQGQASLAGPHFLVNFDSPWIAATHVGDAPSVS